MCVCVCVLGEGTKRVARKILKNIEILNSGASVCMGVLLVKLCVCVHECLWQAHL